MREIDKKIEKLAKQLLNDEITLEEHVRQYNKLIQEESDKDIEGWQPHERI